MQSQEQAPGTAEYGPKANKQKRVLVCEFKFEALLCFLYGFANAKAFNG